MPSPRAAVLAAIFPAMALLACGWGDFKFDLGDAGWDWGDAGLFLNECKADNDCEAGQCCTGFWTASCQDTFDTDPTQPVCSTLDDHHFALCTCVPPQSAPVCPGWYLQPPFAPECAPNPYVECIVSCVDHACYCTTDATFLGDAGVEVPSCPPSNWAALCPSDAGVDGPNDGGKKDASDGGSLDASDGGTDEASGGASTGSSDGGINDAGGDGT